VGEVGTAALEILAVALFVTLCEAYMRIDPHIDVKPLLLHPAPAGLGRGSSGFG
jgi:hypothetical protein